MYFDFLIVGSGLYGATFAQVATEHKKKCLVIDKRSHIAGNAYTENIEGINVHKYGAHIFHTSNKTVWDYVNRYSEFNNYINAPIARYKNELYNLPFNMNTFSKLWNIFTPAEAKAIINAQRLIIDNVAPQNLEEQALSMVGHDIYEKLIKGYTEKQWGMDCKELPAFIIKRLPLRFTYDNCYFNDRYQGIPIGGYTNLVNNMLKGVEVKLNTEYSDFAKYHPNIARKTVYTGMIDEFFNYRYGELEYRSLRFDSEYLKVDNYQGVAVVNYTERDIPYTRNIEHKHFDTYGCRIGKTIITKEYPLKWERGYEPYYPINNEKNNTVYEQYRTLAEQNPNVVFGGRLGKYQYYDMDQVIAEALNDVAYEVKSGCVPL